MNFHWVGNMSHLGNTYFRWDIETHRMWKKNFFD